MSSHHFVIDGQEPALIIANGDSCSIKLLTSLIEWCPYVVVLDGAYSRVKSLQIKPDLVIGDFDSIDSSLKDIDVKFVKSADQETTDLEKAIDYLIANKTNDINIIWATGRRLDHTINNFNLLAKYKNHNVVIYDDFSRAYKIEGDFKKHYPKGTKISLFPISKANNITTNNLVYNLQNETLETGIKSGSSNEVKSTGLVSITHSSGTLILIESTDEI